MNRRAFPQAAGFCGCRLRGLQKGLNAGEGRWRIEVTKKNEALKPSGMTRVWSPAALGRKTP